MKQPHKVGLLETHQSLTEQQFQTFRSQAKLPPGDVVNQLEELDIKIEDLHFLGTLQTKRLEITYNEGSLCLDQSFYLGVTDYEVEFEGQTLEHANETLEMILQSVQLQPLPAKNKVQRFFERKQLLKK
ncbi:CYTH domain-containing protein [Alkalihalobacillus sp. 1P02AB]|uniref:CYTH domain-containing protein n=1 Tax=Alkalihalobacillus sp. 1P02AB TaxID=3132260 RepID=UPI0039A6ACC7